MIRLVKGNSYRYRDGTKDIIVVYRYETLNTHVFDDENLKPIYLHNQQVDMYISDDL